MDILDELDPALWIGKHAWEIDRYLRLNAVPLDRRKHQSAWDEMASGFPQGDNLMLLLWGARVPGSGAPEIPYVEMAQSMANKGYDVQSAEQLLPKGLELAKAGKRDDLRCLSAEFLDRLFDAPKDVFSSYWNYEHPSTWDQVMAEMVSTDHPSQKPVIQNLDEKIYQGWLGQICGGSFGTAIEGYHTSRIAEVYGEIAGYITEPETMNDDVVYELVLLDVYEKLGQSLSSRELGLEWVRQVPFGWSAEMVALNNLRNGILPPGSGSFRNPYSDWIGAQMRGMVCGFLAPGWPLEAARLAFIDGVVSHSANGVYGEIYAAVLTALAFTCNDPRELLVEAGGYVPKTSEYSAVLQECLAAAQQYQDPAAAWQVLDQRFEQYNWIHAYPNLAADVIALWFGGGEVTDSFKLLAMAGMDVDCNAGLVGSVLGVMKGIPEKWSRPIGDRLETYLPGKAELSIRGLAERTARLAIS